MMREGDPAQRDGQSTPRSRWLQPSLQRNVMAHWIATGMIVAYSLFITPIVVGALRKEAYGIWSFLNGLTTYADLLYFGLGSAFIKYFAQHRTAGDRSALDRLASVVLSIYTILGLACLLISLVLSPYAPRVFAEALEPRLAQSVTYTCVLLGIRLLALLIGSVFSGILVGADRTDIAKIVPVGFTLVRCIAVPVYVGGDSPLLILASITTISAVLETLTLARLASAIAADVKTQFVRPRPAELRFLYSFGMRSFFILLSVKLISYTDTTVIGLMLGAPAVAVFSLPLQLMECGRLVVGGIGAVLLPRLTLLHTTGRGAELGAIYIRVARISCFLAAVINVTLVLLGVPFLSRWVGPEFGEPASWILAYLGAASFCQALSTQAPLPFYQAMQVFRVPIVILLIEAVVNLALSIWLVTPLGINGVALATAIPAFCVSFVVLPAYLAARLEVPFTLFFWQAIVPSLVAGGAVAIELTVLNNLLPSSTYQAIGLKALLTVPVAALVASALFPEEDRRIAVPLWMAARLGDHRRQEVWLGERAEVPTEDRRK